MAKPQVVRNLEDIEKLDRDAITLDNAGQLDSVDDWLDSDGKAFPHDAEFLPAVVVANGDQMRAAKRELERADG